MSTKFKENRIDEFKDQWASSVHMYLDEVDPYDLSYLQFQLFAFSALMCYVCFILNNTHTHTHTTLVKVIIYNAIMIVKFKIT